MKSISTYAAGLGLTLLGTTFCPNVSLANDTDFVMSIPLVSFTASSTGHVEFNLGMRAALAIEASYIHEHNRVDEDVTEETGESLLVTGGRSFSAHIGRYSDAARLAGFYWSLGVGYQTMDVRWAVPPDEADPDVELSLVNDAGVLSHHATLKGVTGYGRLGYRYVADEWPFMAGIYLGLTHFQTGVYDYHETADKDPAPGIASLSDKEKERLKRKFVTAFSPGISVGVAF